MNPVTGSSINPISWPSVRSVTPVELASSFAGAKEANINPTNTALLSPVNTLAFEEARLNPLRPSKIAESIFAEQGISPAKLAILSAKPVLIAERISSPEGVIFVVDEGGRANPAQGQSEAIKQSGLPAAESDITSNDQQSQAEKAEKSSAAAQSREQEQDIQVKVCALAARDHEVRNHQLAYSIADGRYSVSSRYEFKRVLDDNSYAVSGEVSTDLGRAARSQVTIEKIEIVGLAALAPVELSSQDHQVTARITANARQGLLAESSQMTRQAESTAVAEAEAQSLESGSISIWGGQQNDGQQRVDVDALRTQRVISLYLENSGLFEPKPPNLINCRA